MLDPDHLTRQYHETGFLSDTVISDFRRAVYDRYRANPRPMPWRESCDPYAILVSEVMLQQTQVSRVLVKYEEFLTEFPDPATLAAAALPDLLRVWQGLGYNRRALALKQCAETVISLHGGRFPETISALEALPGIGPYTARAVAAFAFGIAEPLIETNIRTLFIHFFFHGREKVADREIMPLVAATLDPADPRSWYYALMDMGVMLKQRHPNLGRRSRHHVQQSRFEGSNRQLRSRLLRGVMAASGITGCKLAENLGADKEQVLKNLDALEREGFLETRENGYVIRGTGETR